MFNAYEFQLQMLSDFVNDLSSTNDLASESRQYTILDHQTEVIGKISITPKQIETNTNAFENFKPNLKRSIGQAVAQPPVKKQSAPKVPKVSQQPTKPVQAMPVNSNAPKIDVTSMMSVTQNMSTQEKSYRCSFCGSESSHLTSMKRHIETKHLPSTTSFDCRNCEYKTKLKFMLKRHYMNKHAMPEPAAQGMMTCYN